MVSARPRGPCTCARVPIPSVDDVQEKVAHVANVFVIHGKVERGVPAVVRGVEEVHEHALHACIHRHR